MNSGSSRFKIRLLAGGEPDSEFVRLFDFKLPLLVFVL